MVHSVLALAPMTSEPCAAVPSLSPVAASYTLTVRPSSSSARRKFEFFTERTHCTC